jgi:hypothetical protein
MVLVCLLDGIPALTALRMFSRHLSMSRSSLPIMALAIGASDIKPQGGVQRAARGDARKRRA